MLLNIYIAYTCHLEYQKVVIGKTDEVIFCKLENRDYTR